MALTNSDHSLIIPFLCNFTKLLSFLVHLDLWSPRSLVPKALLPQSRSEHSMTSWSFSLLAYYLHAKHKHYEKVNSPFSKCITEVKQSSSKQLKRSLPIIPGIYSLCVSKSMIKIFSFLSPLEKKFSNRTQCPDRLTSGDMSRNATERVVRQKNNL